MTSGKQNRIVYFFQSPSLLITTTPISFARNAFIFFFAENESKTIITVSFVLHVLSTVNRKVKKTKLNVRFGKMSNEIINEMPIWIGEWMGVWSGRQTEWQTKKTVKRRVRIGEWLLKDSVWSNATITQRKYPNKLNY